MRVYTRQQCLPSGRFNAHGLGLCSPPLPDTIPSAMSAMHFSIALSDDQMRTQLRAGATLVFDGLKQWQTVERQVERLGFGEVYLVSGPCGQRGE